jgi:hypothetical protein
LIDLPDSEESLVFRTDYSDDGAWERICGAIRAPVGEFRAYVTFLSDPRYRGLNAAQIAELLPADFRHSFIFVVDETTFRHSEHPVLVVDLHEKPGGTFRAIPSTMWSVENNLSMANMDFFEFADSVEPDGIFRGFRDAG